MALAIAGLLAGCHTPSTPSVSVHEVQEQDIGLSQSELDLAEALANFSVGVLREGMADSDALTNYLQAVQLRPDRMNLYVRVAAMRLRRGETAEAVAVIKEACRQNPHSGEARLYLAQIYQALKDGDAAQAACREAMRIEPANYNGYLQLALLYRELGDEARAIATLEESLAKVEDRRPMLRLLGDLYNQRAGNILAATITPDIRKAIKYYEQASREPQDELTIPYLQQLGDMYLMTRQIESAIACFTAIATQSPGDIQVQKKLALCYLAVGNKEKAVEYLKVIADQEPRNSDIQYYLGELYENLSDTTNAVSRFTSACAGEPTTNKPYLKLALFYLETDPRKASQVLESGLKQLPEDQKILEMLAQLYLTNRQEAEAKETLYHLQHVAGRYEDRAMAARLTLHYGVVAQVNNLDENAASLYRQTIELDPSLVDAYVRWAFLLLSQDRKDEAVLVMKKADRMLPDDFAVNYFFALLYSRMERYRETVDALETAREAAAADPEDEGNLDSAFYFSYGSACERNGQFSQAEALLQHAFILDSDNIEALNYLAYMWSERGTNLIQALDYVGHALEDEPENGAFLDTLGWIYFKQGRTAEALDEIVNAMVFMPDDPTIMEHMGDVLAALHRAREALFWWEESYRRNPDNQTIGEKLKARGVNLDDLRNKPESIH